MINYNGDDKLLKTADTDYHYKETLKYLNNCKEKKCAIPRNIVINISFKLNINEWPVSYNELTKKYKKIIEAIDMFYMQYVQDNILYSKCKSVHVANLTYKNQQIIRTNDYNRTYYNNTNITSLHAEHSVVSTYCKICKSEPILEKNNSILCVIRYNKQGRRCNSRPCNHCAYQIWRSNIKTVIYSMDDELFHFCKIKQ